MPMAGFFITGTDTGVGKTRFASILAHTLISNGINVKVCKPVATGGHPGDNGDLLSDDTLKLTGVIPDDWKQTFLFLKAMGYDLNRSIAEQFAEKYSLPYKELNPKERIGKRLFPSDFGLT